MFFGQLNLLIGSRKEFRPPTFRDRVEFLEELCDREPLRGIDENMPMLLSPRKDPRADRIEDEIIRFAAFTSDPSGLPLCVEDPVCEVCSDLTNLLRR